MATKPLDGFRVLEVAQFTFVPLAGTDLSRGTGQWAPVQDAWDLANDESLIGRIAEIIDAEGNSWRLVNSPIKFDEGAAELTRAPQFAEHTDEVIRELGVDEERLIELKIAGATT